MRREHHHVDPRAGDRPRLLPVDVPGAAQESRDHSANEHVPGEAPRGGRLAQVVKDCQRLLHRPGAGGPGRVADGAEHPLPRDGGSGDGPALSGGRLPERGAGDVHPETERQSRQDLWGHRRHRRVVRLFDRHLQQWADAVRAVGHGHRRASGRLGEQRGHRVHRGHNQSIGRWAILVEYDDIYHVHRDNHPGARGGVRCGRDDWSLRLVPALHQPGGREPVQDDVLGLRVH
mmetsp:Transcript_32757/g.87634  ORF Transcript_32757/g.87634 Transcript_32757/m.87634 type:complete len:232 (-) Transcript_32757:1875-2570(-)